MKPTLYFLVWLTTSFYSCTSVGQKVEKNTLQLEVQIPLNDISGRIDHIAYNSNGTVYVTALHNNSILTVDLYKKTVIATIKGVDEPQGCQYIPQTNELFVTSGGNG